MAGLKRRHEDSSFAASLTPKLRADSPSLPINNNYTREGNREDDRVHSPNNIMEAHNVFMPPTRESKRTLTFASKRDDENDPDAEKRVTIWNWREQRKLSGNSAPFKKNLKDYIRKHPDWEEYVNQDKDALTGKKLSPKKMKPPAPQDPSHPWYTQKSGASMPLSPSAPSSPLVAPHTSSYGTRSTQSRLQENDAVRTSTRAAAKPDPPPLEEPIYVNPELSQPMEINLEPPAVVARRRSLEMAARHRALASEAHNCDENDDTNEAEIEAAKVAEEEAARWEAASQEVARARAEKEAAERKLAEDALNERRSAHAKLQHDVVGSAMSRIEAFRNKRRMIAA